MKKNIKVIYWIEVALLVVNLIFYLSNKVIPSEYNKYLVITFLLFMIIPLRMFFGKQKDSSYYTGYTIRTVVTVLMVIGIIIYLLGLLLGFTKGYAYTFNNLFRLVIPIIVLSIVSEYFRFIVVKNSYNSIKSIVIFTVLLSLLEVFAITNFRTLGTSYKIFVFICISVFFPDWSDDGNEIRPVFFLPMALIGGLTAIFLVDRDTLKWNKDARVWRAKFDQVMMKARSIQGDSEFQKQIDYYENSLKGTGGGIRNILSPNQNTNLSPNLSSKTLWIVIALLVIVILFLVWPQIKMWLYLNDYIDLY